MKFQQQKGVAAVEFALVTLVVVLLIPLPLYVSQALLILQKMRTSTAMAGMVLSQAEPVTFSSSSLVSALYSQARQPFADDMAENGIVTDASLLTFLCDGGVCGSSQMPSQLTAASTYEYTVANYLSSASEYLGQTDIALSSVVVVPYAN